MRPAHSWGPLLLTLCLLALVGGLPHPQQEEEEEGEQEERPDAELGDSDDIVGGFQKKGPKQPIRSKFPRRYKMGLKVPSAQLDQDELDRDEDMGESDLVGAILRYNALELELVSPVKDQGENCGSCVAFAMTAVLETCYKKLTGRFLSFSEQYFLDCAFGYEEAEGCKGSMYHSYMAWALIHQQYPSSKRYPYSKEVGRCRYDPARMVEDPTFRGRGGVYSYWQTNETRLTAYVIKYSAVLAGMWFTQQQLEAFYDHKEGIFNACTPNAPRDNLGHAVTVVGFDRDNTTGQDYWIIKNSWGTGWGEGGFFKLPRGIMACGIGSTYTALGCDISKPSSSQATRDEGEEQGEEEQQGEEEGQEEQVDDDE